MIRQVLRFYKRIVDGIPYTYYGFTAVICFIVSVIIFDEGMIRSTRAFFTVGNVIYRSSTLYRGFVFRFAHVLCKENPLKNHGKTLQLTTRSFFIKSILFCYLL